MPIETLKRALVKLWPLSAKPSDIVQTEVVGLLVSEKARAVDVSVVMPSLNQAEYIERSIRSVLDQKTEASLELIVMDGGSNDGTLEILSRMAMESQGRLRWYSEADHGPAHAVNKAMAKARGEIIGWLNADDLYTPGAIQRAVKAMQENPEWCMLYGQGEHIDACDASIGDYSTQRPNTPLQAFADGCFICQPTVFLRRQLLNNLGGLNEALKTTFDFELWLRIFQQHPERIGFIDATQAQSRLHSACLTRTQRETVIRESMQVVARFLGHCPIHWVRTYIDEIFADYPHGGKITDMKKHLGEFIDSVSGYLSVEEQKEMDELVKTDARIRLATRDACLEVYPDGWLAERARLRVQFQKHRWGKIRLDGEHVSKSNCPLRLTVHSPDGSKHECEISTKGKFTLQIALPKPAGLPAYWTYYIESEGGFVPQDCEPGSNDSRRLACRIDSLQLIA